MEEKVSSILIYVSAVFIASVSQILLKKAAMKKTNNLLEDYINPLVITAYGLLVGTTLLTIKALQELSVSMGSVLESLGYIFVAILSRVFLNEKMSKKSLIGYVFIIVGIFLFSVNV